MRQTLIILFTLLSIQASAQNIEISAAAYGLGNYGNSLNPNRDVFETASFSPMIGAAYIRPWLREGSSNFSLEGGIGMSYTHYKGKWTEPIFSSGLTTTGSIEYEQLHQFEGNIHVLGFEFTPLIATFWKRLELRSGLFLGLNLSDGYSYNLLVNQTIYENGNVQFVDGVSVNYPVEGPQFVLHSNSRISFRIPVAKYTLSPFYQFSVALDDEGESEYYDKVLSYRHHVGASFRFGGK